MFRKKKVCFPMSIFGGHFPTMSISGRINLSRKYFGLLILDFECLKCAYAKEVESFLSDLALKLCLKSACRSTCAIKPAHQMIH